MSDVLERLDAAWVESQRLIESRHYTERMRGYEMRRELNILGIERCEGCGGRGSIEQEIIETAHESGGMYHKPCPDCAKYTGRGWVKNE